MSNVTYLFGAGASANALPVVSQISSSLETLLVHLSERKRELFLTSAEQESIQWLINDVKWVQSENERHASIDTFAKKLFIKGKYDEVRKLKVIIAFLFGYCQTVHRVDSRYDSFFASIIMDSQLDLPKSLKVISWNYDHQFELAFSEFSQIEGIYANQHKLNVVAKTYKDSKFRDHFGIFKVNGTASFFRSHSGSISWFDLLQTNILDPRHIARLYTALLNDNEIVPCISFSWEADVEAFLQRVAKSVAETEILVVIGYSFPFFNRETDRMLINGMKALRRVYFQSPDAESVKERFLAIRENIPSKELVIRNDVSQFLIPAEFNF